MGKMKELVYDIVEMFNEYHMPMSEIAKQFGLSIAEVEHVIQQYGQEDFEPVDAEYDNLPDY